MQGVTHVGIFTLTTATALVMYLYAVFTDPGRRAPLARAASGLKLTAYLAAQRAAQLGARRGGRSVRGGEEKGAPPPPCAFWPRLRSLTRLGLSLWWPGGRAALLPEVQAA